MRGTALLVRAVAAVAVVAALALGTWFWAGTVAPGYWSSIVLGVAWFVTVSLVAGRLTKGRPAVRRWTRTAFVLCAVVSAAGFYWTSVRTTTVNERVITGVPASEAGDAPALDPDDR